MLGIGRALAETAVLLFTSGYVDRMPASWLDSGRVLAVHIDDAAITADGRIDIVKLRPLARMGYHDYTSVQEVFTLRPEGSAARAAGLEGSPEKVAAGLLQDNEGAR